jgi:hypothetical protein
MAAGSCGRSPGLREGTVAQRLRGEDGSAPGPHAMGCAGKTDCSVALFARRVTPFLSSRSVAYRSLFALGVCARDCRSPPRSHFCARTYDRSRRGCQQGERDSAATVVAAQGLRRRRRRGGQDEDAATSPRPPISRWSAPPSTRPAAEGGVRANAMTTDAEAPSPP